MKKLHLLICLVLSSGAVAGTDRGEKDYPADLKRAALDFSVAPKVREINMKAVIEPLFPLGLSKEETAARLRIKFRLAESGLRYAGVEKKPLEFVRDGKELKIVSWISVTLLSFRSLKTFGARDYIGAQFDFDEQGKLANYMVFVSYGPEL